MDLKSMIRCHGEVKDFTMTHISLGSSHLHPMGQLTNTRRSDGSPDPDGVLKKVTRIQIRHYRNVTFNHPDRIDFIPLVVDTTGRLYDDFIRLLFMLTVKHLPWLRMNCQRNRISFVSLEVRVSLIWRVLLVWLWSKCRLCWFQSPWTSHLGVSFRFLVTRFIRSRRHTPLLTPSLVLFPPCSV